MRTYYHKIKTSIMPTQETNNNETCPKNSSEILSEGSNLKTSISLILHPVSNEINSVNQIAFKEYAHIWAIRYKFFPVLRFIENETLFIKFYYYYKYDDLKNDYRRITNFANTYYYEVAGIKNYKRVNFLTIRYTKIIPEALLKRCRDMDELETIHLATICDNGKVSCLNNGHGASTEEGKWPYGQFRIFENLIERKFINNQNENQSIENNLNNNYFLIDSTEHISERSYLRILGGRWDYSRAGQCFVMPYRSK